MTAIVHLQFLPDEADASDIRGFFRPLQIPKSSLLKKQKIVSFHCSLFSGGVYIYGGDRGDAYIVFHTIEDACQAIRKNGDLICQYPVTLSLCPGIEIPFRDIGENQNVGRTEETFDRQGKILANFFILRINDKRYCHCGQFGNLMID